MNLKKFIFIGFLAFEMFKFKLMQKMAQNKLFFRNAANHKKIIPKLEGMHN